MKARSWYSTLNKPKSILDAGEGENLHPVKYTQLIKTVCYPHEIIQVFGW